MFQKRQETCLVNFRNLNDIRIRQNQLAGTYDEIQQFNVIHTSGVTIFRCIEHVLDINEDSYGRLACHYTIPVSSATNLPINDFC